MAYSNNMGKLIKLIERRCGLMPLVPHFPDKFKYDAWAEVIEEDTLPTFSRYYPYKIIYIVDERTPKRNGYYYLNKELIGNVKVIGIGDIDWQEMGQSGATINPLSQYGFSNVHSGYMCLDTYVDQLLLQNSASMFNNGVFVDADGPEKFRLVSIGDPCVNINHFPIQVYIQHSPSLVTIEPTKMETFETLAIGDVATFLYENLKYYEFSTSFANIDMKLSELQDKARKRDETVEKLEQNYVSAGNKAIPFIISQ